MRNKRRRILVDKPVQGGIATRLAIYWGCSIVVAFTLSIIVQCALDPHTPFLTQLSHAKTAIFPIAAAFLLMLPVVMLDLTRLTNRFAGPVYRLKNAMRGYREGTFHGKVKFRDKDYWQDLADEFNLLVEQVEAWKREAQENEKQEPVGAGSV